MKILSFKIAFAVSLFVVPAFVSAVESNELDRRADYISKMKSWYLAYETSRDVRFYGEQGYLRQAKRIILDLNSWTENWKIITRKYVEDLEPNKSFLQIQQELWQSIVDQNTTMARIIHDQIGLKQSIEAELDQLSKIQPPSYQLIGTQTEFDVQLQTISQYLASLKTLAQDTTATVEEVNRSAEFASKALKAKVSVIIIQKSISAQEAAQKMAVDLFEAEKILIPMILDLNTSLNELLAHHRQMRIFGVLDSNDRVKKLCQEFPQRVATTSIEIVYKEGAKKIVAANCANITSLADSLLARTKGNINQLVAMALGSRGKKLKQFCTSTDASIKSQVNCPTYAWLASISKEQIMAMDTVQLRHLESTYDSLEQGARQLSFSPIK